MGFRSLLSHPSKIAPGNFRHRFLPNWPERQLVGFCVSRLNCTRLLCLWYFVQNMYRSFCIVFSQAWYCMFRLMLCHWLLTHKYSLLLPPPPSLSLPSLSLSLPLSLSPSLSLSLPPSLSLPFSLSLSLSLSPYLSPSFSPFLTYFSWPPSLDTLIFCYRFFHPLFVFSSSSIVCISSTASYNRFSSLAFAGSTFQYLQYLWVVLSKYIRQGHV